MAYDARSIRGGADARRRDHGPAVRHALAILALLVGLMVGRAVYEQARGATGAETPAVRHDSLAPTYTHDGEVIRWYVLVDPDTSVQYLVNDRGGCCPRLDRYGIPIGTRAHDDEADYG